MTLGRLSLCVAALVVGGVAVAGVTRAGQKSGSTLQLSNGDASGSLGNIRNSSNALEYAGCRTTSSGGARTAYCQFRNSAGTFKECSTSDLDLVAVAATMVGDSSFYIQFNASGVCTFIEVVNGSWAAPKNP